MRIPKNSWHYRVYKFTYVFKDFQAPEQTNLCRYVSRTVLYPVPIFLAMITLLVLGGGFLIILPNVVTILFGFGTVTLEEGGVHRYHPFTKLSAMGRRIPAWAIVNPTWLLFALATLVVFFPSQITTVGTYGAYGVGGVTVGVLALYVLYLIIAVIVSAYRRWEGWDVAKEYVKAKKRRICPVINFDETDPQTHAG